jgi:competence protein ComEC
VLLPFGWQDIALYILSPGIKAMLWVGKTVSAWPHALTYMPGPTEWGMAIAMLGLCWVCLWHTRARRYGIYAVLLGTATLCFIRAPEFYMSPRAAQVALATGQGPVLLKGRANGLFPTLWANASGHASLTEYRKVAPLPEAECNKEHCRITRGDTRIHISFTVPDIKKGCPDADWWISSYHLYPEERAPCTGMQFFDRSDFDSKGSAWGWFTPEGLQMHSTRELQGDRAWVARPSPARRYGSPHASGTPGEKRHTPSVPSAR